MNVFLLALVYISWCEKSTCYSVFGPFNFILVKQVKNQDKLKLLTPLHCMIFVNAVVWPAKVSIRDSLQFDVFCLHRLNVNTCCCPCPISMAW